MPRPKPMLVSLRLVRSKTELTHKTEPLSVAVLQSTLYTVNPQANISARLDMHWPFDPLHAVSHFLPSVRFCANRR